MNSKYEEWELEFRCERIIATKDLLREKIRETQKIYDELLAVYQREKTLRSGN